MFDLLIKNGTVVNGREKPFRADVAVEGERIADVGNIETEARHVLDAAGRVVCPGFVDIHSHDDFALTRETPELSKLTQGVTTEVIGNCGFSGAPYTQDAMAFFDEYVFPVLGEKGSVPHWYTWEKYLQVLDESALPLNAVPLVGQGNLRVVTMGVVNRAPTAREMSEMKELLSFVMSNGCWGMSTGLIYPPGVFTPTEELIELSRVVARSNGIYTSHVRGETSDVVDAVREALEIGREAGISVEIAHLKAAGKKNWGKTDELLAEIDASRDSGIDVNFDMYPYIAGSTSLTALLPPWMHEGGVMDLLERLKTEKLRRKAAEDIKEGLPGWQNFAGNCEWKDVRVSQTRSEKGKQWEGRNLEDIAAGRGEDPMETLFNLILEENASIGMVIFLMSDESVRKIARHPLGFFGTDGLPHPRPHPRTWGTYPRVFRQFVREERLLSVEEAVYKCSTGPADKFGLSDRGRILTGKAADMVIFDVEEISDQATYENPATPASGIDFVVVNGKLAIDRGRVTGKNAGRLLLKK